MELPDSLIRTARRQLRWTLTLRESLQGITIYLFAWGVFIVAARSLATVEREALAWGAIGIGVAAVVALYRAQRRLPDEAAIRALCDRQQRCGGLVMSEGELDLGGWLTRRRLAPLRFRWQGRRHAALLTVGLAFVGTAFAVPDPQGSQRQPAQPDVRFAGNVEDLERKLDLLAEEEAIDPAQADDLRKAVEDLDRTARDDAMRAWEMVDHVDEQLSQAAEQAAEDAVDDTAALADLGSLAGALAEDQASETPRVDANAAAEALDHLADGMDKLDPDLARALADQLADSGLDADALRERADKLRNADGETGSDEARSLDAEAREQLEKLAQACEAGGDGGSEKVGRLVEARLVDPQWAQACEAAGESDGNALLAALSAAGGPSENEDIPAPMTFNQDPVATEDAAYESVALNPAALDRDQSTLLGLSSAAPDDTDPPSPSADVSALEGAATGGGSTTSQTILPRHRGSVERYFQRE